MKKKKKENLMRDTVSYKKEKRIKRKASDK